MGLPARRNQYGFTLGELLIVGVILVAVAFILVPRVGSTANGSKIQVCRTNVKIINSQVERFFANEGRWPASWGSFQNRPLYFDENPPECPFGSNYTMSNETHRAAYHKH